MPIPTRRSNLGQLEGVLFELTPAALLYLARARSAGERRKPSSRR